MDYNIRTSPYMSLWITDVIINLAADDGQGAHVIYFIHYFIAQSTGIRVFHCTKSEMCIQPTILYTLVFFAYFL